MKKIVNVSSVILFISLLLVFDSIKTSAQTVEKKELVPTVTIPAPPGSKGFGMPQATRPNNSTNTNAVRRMRASASITDANEIVTTTLDEMSMSDPYILADKATQTYYLTSSGGAIYKSKDLKNWTGTLRCL